MWTNMKRKRNVTYMVDRPFVAAWVTETGVLLSYANNPKLCVCVACCPFSSLFFITNFVCLFVVCPFLIGCWYQSNNIIWRIDPCWVYGDDAAIGRLVTVMVVMAMVMVVGWNILTHFVIYDVGCASMERYDKIPRAIHSDSDRSEPV